MALHEGRHQRRNMAAPEAQGGVHAQQALGLRLHVGHELLHGVDFRQDAARVL